MNRFAGKNILGIYYTFPPIKGIGTLRNYKFYKSLRKVARKVHVFTTTNRKFMPEDDFRIQYENIHELETFDFRTMHHNFWGSKGSLLSDNDKPSRLARAILSIIKKPPLEDLIGEGGIKYIQSGIKKGCKVIEDEGIDVIISSYIPYASHKIAVALKKKYPHVHWIADFRDLPTDPMRSSGAIRKIYKRRMKSLLKHADEVMTVSEGLANNLRKYHNNVSVVRNGIELKEFTYAVPEDYKFFTFSYTGIIYEDKQMINCFITALSNLIKKNQVDINDLQFIHAGRDGNYIRSMLKEKNLSNLLVDKGIVPRSESLNIQRKSHINILLTWSTYQLTGIVTGKLYEYIAAKKPILTIINGIKDPEIKELIEGSNSGKVFYHSDISVLGMEKFILQKYNSWKKGNSLRIQNNDIRNLSWETEFNNWSQADSSPRNTSIISEQA